ncbi:MAG: hypothetical protein V3W41_10485 [Planctomycetota bacterium]
MKTSFLVLSLALALSACATRDGIDTNATLSAGTVPVAGEVFSATGDVIDATDATANAVADSAVNVATGIIVAPFEIAESFLGLDENGQVNPYNTQPALTYEERLARRRSQRGLPMPSAMRVKERQAAMRLQQRRATGF